MRQSNFKTELIKMFSDHPDSAYNVAGIMKIFPNETEGNIRYHLGTIAKGSGVLRAVVVRDFQRGFYRLNPKYETLAQIRAQVTNHVLESQRVIQGENKFDPTKQVISSVYPIKRLFLQSILERMERSSDFVASDIQLLHAELSHILAPEPEKVKVM